MDCDPLPFFRFEERCGGVFQLACASIDYMDLSLMSYTIIPNDIHYILYAYSRQYHSILFYFIHSNILFDSLVFYINVEVY